MNGRRLLIRVCTGVLLAGVAAPSGLLNAAVLENPDQRPSVTFGVGGGVGRHIESVSGYGESVDFQHADTGELSPFVQAVVPVRSSLTLLFGGQFTRWNWKQEEPLEYVDATGTYYFNLKARQSGFSGFFGVKLYLGK